MILKLITKLISLVFFLTLYGCEGNGSAPKPEIKRAHKTIKVTSTEIRTYIEATGSVQPDIEGSSKILSHLAGTVTKIFVNFGERVKKTDPLVAIASPEVTDIYSSYLSVLTQLKQAERIYHLNKELFQFGAITRNDLLNSESSVKQLSAQLEGLKDKLTIYGFTIDKDSIPQKQNRGDTVLIKAPLNGYVADIQAHVGDRVDMTTPLLTLADPKKIMVVANLYDTDLPKVKKGSRVIFSVDGFPGQSFEGVVTYISDVSDLESKTVKTFIRILNQTVLFKQNMFLHLRIEGEKKTLPLIPQTAMIYKDGKFFVYCLGSNGHSVQKEIKPVKEVPGKLMAVEGVAVGEEIVLSAIELEKT
jgi:cobalt-zinc-cadmium efflux system membrane fusion protein